MEKLTKGYRFLDKMKNKVPQEMLDYYRKMLEDDWKEIQAEEQNEPR